MTELEICDLLLAIPNIKKFKLLNIGEDPVMKFKHPRPFLMNVYTNAIKYGSATAYGYRLQEETMINDIDREDIINFLHPHMTVTDDINTMPPHDDINKTYRYQLYEITQAAIQQLRKTIRRKTFTVDDIC